MRLAIKKAVELASKGVDKLVLELPTGYGKTVAGPELYKAYRKAGLCWRAIHIFPLRAILHKTLEKYTKTYKELEFTYQDGDVTLMQRGYVKDVYFKGEYVLTTIDSFIHNLLKAPIAEWHKLFLKKSRAIHYHQPFAYIYPSCVFFDEAHVAAQDDSGKMMSALRAAINSLRDADIPVVIMSATLGQWKHHVFKDFTFIELGERDAYEDKRVVVHDEEFESALEGVSYKAEVIEEEEVAELARRRAEEGRRVLVIVNSVKRAMKLAEELDAVLIHSMLTRRDRKEAEEKLGDAKIVVGTSAIEAGVDVSFDVLISSADSVESVAQRVGRVCRYGGNCRGEIYLYGDLADSLSQVAEWRLPYKEHSYAELLPEEAPKNPGHEWILNELGRRLYVDVDDLKSIIRKIGGSYVREGLVEVCTEPNCNPELGFTASMDRVADLKPVAIIAGKCKREPPKKYDVDWLLDVVDECGEMPKVLIEGYKEGYGPSLD